MISLYLRLKNDVAHESMRILAAEIILLFALGVFNCYISIPTVVFVVLFGITSLSFGELISRSLKANNQKGWILVDALIGLVIFSVALTTMIVMYTQATKANIKTRDYDYAVYVAQQNLENIKQYDGTATIKSLPEDVKNPLVQQSAIGIQFTTQIRPLTTVSETLDSRLYPYQATVSWTDTAISPPAQHSIQVSAYYYSN